MIRIVQGRRLLEEMTPIAGLALIALAFGVRLVPALNLENPVSDIAWAATVADMVLRGDLFQEYRLQPLFPFLNHSQFLAAGLLQAARSLGWGFDLLFKLPLILADAIAAGLIFGYLRWTGASLTSAVFWGAAWALNPVSILISAFHGSSHALVPVLVAGAFVAARVATTAHDRTLLLTLSGLLLGLAVAIRAFPILMVPAFLVLATRTLRERATFCVLALLPVGLAALPSVLLVPESVFWHALRYNGEAAFGWVSVMRAILYLRPEGYSVYQFDYGLIAESNRLFLLAYILFTLILPFFHRESLGKALALTPLLFYVLYGGVAVQWLCWVIPLGILLRDPRTLPYSALAATGLVCYYVVYHPAILFGRFGLSGGAWRPPIVASPAIMAIDLVSNVLLVGLCAVWAAQLIRAELALGLIPRRWPRSTPWPFPAAPRWANGAFPLLVLATLGAWIFQLGLTARLAAQVFTTVVWP